MQNKKIVIWGLSINSHTHSYIHNAFYRAFKHLNYETYWLPDEVASLRKLNFSNSVFITVNIADKYIPIRDDCYYILHNCNDKKFIKLFENNKAILIQTFTKDKLSNTKDSDVDFKTDNPFIFGIKEVLYLHWMTDLLPHEIDENIKNFIDYEKRDKICSWIGSVNDCPVYGNYKQIKPFKDECEKNNIKFTYHGLYTDYCINDNIAHNTIKNSYMAPAINGHWQRDNGYIPCRIFKNISYGHISGTNNEFVHKLFNSLIPYHHDTDKLFYEMLNAYKNKDAKEHTIKLMIMVRDKFTYINLIKYIFDFFKSRNKNF
jgi:hypothetical protein